MAASASTAAAPPPPIRLWRTSFLTLRDETLTSPPRASLPNLLHSLIFSNSNVLTSAVVDLPPHEVTSDLMFLMELLGNVHQISEIAYAVYSQSFHLIQDVIRRISIDVNASTWKRMIDSFGKIIEVLMGKDGTSEVHPCNSIRPLVDCFETLRRIVGTHRISSISENVELVTFLCRNITRIHSDLYCFSQSGSRSYGSLAEKRLPRSNNLWEVQTLAFFMLGESFSRVGSPAPANIWESVIEVLRKEMDILASRYLLVEDHNMSNFYASLLQCLHLVLADTKSSVSEHVPSFVAGLRLFFTYGLASSRPQLVGTVVDQKEKEENSLSSKLSSNETKKRDPKLYRPPHLRSKETINTRKIKHLGSTSKTLSDQESSSTDYLSSDSEYSDSDISIRDADTIRKSKVRVAALLCVQDLCQADSKSFTRQWTMLLPTNDVLQSRKFDATLMTCLFFDPYLKVRLASASTLAVMLDGPSSISMQVAEYRESSKPGSFTSLSSSLGQILLQLHKGVIHLIMHETHNGLLASLCKILMLLISSTPYARMPEDLLPTVISSLRTKVEEGFQSNSDCSSLLAATISCLTAALSTTPTSLRVQEMLTEEISQGFEKTKKNSGVLLTLFRQSEQLNNLTISFEALQALRTLSHTYPKVMLGCWEQVFSIVYKYLEAASLEVPRSPRRGSSGNTIGVPGEKVTTAAIKVLDDCLRAVSGFKGTEDLYDDMLHEKAFTSDCTRTKKISSAPFYGNENPHDPKDDPGTNYSGTSVWNEAIEKYLPLTLWNSSSMVRSASVTCFAGITSSVFFSLPKHHQESIVSSTIRAAVEDKAPSVRSAACRAIGVIICFLDISRSAEILSKFIHAVEINTHDSLVMVRITASWALANICDSLHHCSEAVHPEYFVGSDIDAPLLMLLIECALRLTNDSDKIKPNAVRALGSVSRYVIFANLPVVHEKSVGYNGSSSTKSGGSAQLGTGQWVSKTPAESCDPASAGGRYWLERIVQAFLSCITTGNVKVQWNVCHALSNLFRNATLSLKDKDWSPVFSILLLLLRDSPNYKIRIQAAAALAVPETTSDYGRSFTDVVKGLQHVLENRASDQISGPSSFKYRASLEKQLTTTMLHVLGLVSSIDHQPLKDFLLKKATYFEEWLPSLCSSINGQNEAEIASITDQKKELITKALRSLTEVFNSRNHHTAAEKFKVDRPRPMDVRRATLDLESFGLNLEISTHFNATQGRVLLKSCKDIRVWKMN